LGNLRTATFNWLLARATGGRFIVRLDDTDQARYNAQAEAEMLNALRWLGLNWDEGPDVGGPHAPYRQSQRLDLYHAAAERLVEIGSAYRPDDEPHVVRLRTPPEGQVVLRDAIRGNIRFNYTRVPRDPVLIKSDGFPTYHLATVVDDQAMGITHILRGEEWIPSAPIHLQLFDALGYPAPVFAHLPLVTDRAGKKLKKRDPAFEVRNYREDGFLPEAMINYLVLLGWHPGTEDEIFTPEELIQRFSLDRFSKSPAAFDENRLRWFNQQHLARLDADDLTRRVIPRLREAYPQAAAWDSARLTRLVTAVREELVTLADVVPATRFAFEFSEPTIEARAALTSESALAVITAFCEALRDIPILDAERSAALLADLRARFKASHGWGGRVVMFPIRAALTGTVTGPHLADVISVLGKDECLRRIELVRPML